MKNSQEVATIIKKAAKAANIPVGELLTNCGLSKNALSSMQSGGYFPRTENLVNIAEHLNCSVDYLLGRTDNPISHKQQSLEMISNAPINGSYNLNAGNISVNNSGLNPYQNELIGQFNKLTTIQQAKLLSFVSDIVDGKTNL